MVLHTISTISGYASNVIVSGALPGLYIGQMAYASFNKFCPCVPSLDNDLAETIEAHYSEFFNRHPTCQPVHITEKTIMGSSSFSGDSCLPTSLPVIRLPAGLRDFDMDAYGYRLKREYSHCKYHDVLLKNFIGTLLTVPGAVFNFMPAYSAFAGTMIIGAVATEMFGRYTDFKADEFANRESTNAELKGGLCLYLAERSIIQERKPDACGKIVLFFAKVLYPTVNQRIKSVMTVLREREISVRTTDENLLKDIDAEKEPLINPGREVFNLDDPDVVVRIARLKGIISGHRIAVEV